MCRHVILKFNICAADVAGSTDSGSDHINDAYKFPVKPSTKDIKLINWAYNTSENSKERDVIIITLIIL